MNNQEFIDSNIKVIGVVDLHVADHSCDLLYSTLYKLKKDYYAPDEKIIVLHTDTEYFYHGNNLGFTTHNLFSCWRNLNIPFHVMVMYTTQFGIHQSIDPFIVSTADTPTIVPIVVDDRCWINICNFPKFEVKKNILYPAVCLLGRSRNHRVKMFQYLAKHNLFELVRTNFNSSFHTETWDHRSPMSKWHNVWSNTYSTIEVPTVSLTDGKEFIFTYPHRINESCFISSKHPEIVDLNLYPVYNRNDPAVSGEINNFYNNFFLDVVGETVFNYPNVFISEKILKPLMFKTPFLLFGAPRTLDYLTKFGFKTFSDFWDESYDHESDHHLRFLKCCSILQTIVTKPLEELISMYYSMHSILEHNHSRLLEYVETEHIPLYNKLKKLSS